jgi:hypothetical protein
MADVEWQQQRVLGEVCPNRTDLRLAAARFLLSETPSESDGVLCCLRCSGVPALWRVRLHLMKSIPMQAAHVEDVGGSFPRGLSAQVIASRPVSSASDFENSPPLQQQVSST